jgi:predicted transcriptional regulator
MSRPTTFRWASYRLIRDVYQALATIGQASDEPIKVEPAVAVKKSVLGDQIVCLDCGASLKMLKRHLADNHQMTPKEYRAKWNLPASYSMVAAEYAAKRSQLAKDSGLGRKVAAPLPPKKESPVVRSGDKAASGAIRARTFCQTRWVGLKWPALPPVNCNQKAWSPDMS